MERQQEGQQDALVEVMQETDCLAATHRPRGSPADDHGRFKYIVALVTVMGFIIVALLVVFLQHFFMSTSCNQLSLPPDTKAQCYTTYKLKKSDEQGRYDIFTVNKTASYLIYGEVKNVTSEEVVLIATRKTSRTIQKKSRSDGEVFLLDKVKLVSGTRISIAFESTDPNMSQFFVKEL